MIVEQPKFPTPEDELRASLLWQAMHESVAANVEVPVPGVPGTKPRAAVGADGVLRR